MSLGALRGSLALVLLLISACDQQSMTVDAGPMTSLDAGVEPVACDSPFSCRDAGLDQACRRGQCLADVPCGDDAECGLGERCVRGMCRFTGCVGDTDCATGKCLTDTFSCVECGSDSDCPADRPACSPGNQCVPCKSDAQCGGQGAPYCSPEGSCVHCLVTEHCPTGLTCSAGHVCTGVKKGQRCSATLGCDVGLVCVSVGTALQCLPKCNLASKTDCGTEICYRVTDGAGDLIFDDQGPTGVCYRSQAGLRGVREPCQRTATTSSCQPNLECVPDSAQASLCRPFCNPLQSGGCLASERCVAFTGDFYGHRYGLCLPQNGYGDVCARDATCKPGLSCQPFADSSADYYLSPVCQFDVGTKSGMSPCSDVQLSDGGIIAANRTCKSGTCASDPITFNSTQLYCYSACQQDSDCVTDAGVGVCDAQFSLSTSLGMTGSMLGCRPSCTEHDQCARYGHNAVCRIRYTLSSITPMFHQTCATPSGVGLAGDACTANGQCRSNYCYFEDGRGVTRPGVCVEPCVPGGAACATDGTTETPVSCVKTAVVAWYGGDYQYLTADDTYHVKDLCIGGACISDDDCATDGGTSVCTADADPADPKNATVLRCRRALVGGQLRGGETCTFNTQCRSGVCGAAQPPSTATNNVCLEPCTASTVCAAGMSCREAAVRVKLPSGGTVALDSCAP